MFLNGLLPSISVRFHDLASEESDIILLESMQCLEALRLKFDKYMHNVRDEYLGKLAQFWLIRIGTMSNKYKNRVFD